MDRNPEKCSPRLSRIYQFSQQQWLLAHQMVPTHNEIYSTCKVSLFHWGRGMTGGGGLEGKKKSKRLYKGGNNGEN